MGDVEIERGTGSGFPRSPSLLSPVSEGQSRCDRLGQLLHQPVQILTAAFVLVQPPKNQPLMRMCTINH